MKEIGFEVSIEFGREAVSCVEPGDKGCLPERAASPVAKNRAENRVNALGAPGCADRLQ
jgi:hypothetical protein